MFDWQLSSPSFLVLAHTWAQIGKSGCSLFWNQLEVYILETLAPKEDSSFQHHS